MGDVALNDMKGKLAEIIDAGGDIIVIPLSAVEADATFQDGYVTTFVAGGGNGILDAAGNTEQTGSTWVRKVHLNAAITTTVDDSANLLRIILDADDSWLSVLSSNDVVALLICEDGASDAVRRVIGSWAFVVTTDGNDVTANYDQTNGIWTAA
jgi:hypothetical protein